MKNAADFATFLRILLNEELRHLYNSCGIVRIMKFGGYAGGTELGRGKVEMWGNHLYREGDTNGLEN
jgi:hypothetical protein